MIRAAILHIVVEYAINDLLSSIPGEHPSGFFSFQDEFSILWQILPLN